jgi:hypothetical protein
MIRKRRKRAFSWFEIEYLSLKNVEDKREILLHFNVFLPTPNPSQEGNIVEESILTA